MFDVFNQVWCLCIWLRRASYRESKRPFPRLLAPPIINKRRVLWGKPVRNCVPAEYWADINPLTSLGEAAFLLLWAGGSAPAPHQPGEGFAHAVAEGNFLALGQTNVICISETFVTEGDGTACSTGVRTAFWVECLKKFVLYRSWLWNASRSCNQRGIWEGNSI